MNATSENNLIISSWLMGFKNEMDGKYNSLKLVYRIYGSRNSDNPYEIFGSEQIIYMLEKSNSMSAECPDIKYQKSDILVTGRLLKTYLYLIDFDNYVRLQLDFEHWIIGNYSPSLLENHIEELNRFYPDWQYQLIPPHCRYYPFIQN